MAENIPNTVETIQVDGKEYLTCTQFGNYGYTSKRQHLLYIAASGIPTFEYLVGVW